MAPTQAIASEIPDPLKNVFEKLYMSQLTTENGMMHNQMELETLQNEFMKKQVQQNVMEKLMNITTESELQDVLKGEPLNAQKMLDKQQEMLNAVVEERNTLLKRIHQAVIEVQQEKENALAHEHSRDEYMKEMETLQTEWKELQKRNAQRKATIQMSTGMLINDEDDCSRILDTQTMEIQTLHGKQKQLEEQQVDLSTQLKHTTEKITRMEKQNEARSRDLAVQQREEELSTLDHMKQWYESMTRLLTLISGIEITEMTNEWMEICFIQTHTIRCYFDQITTKLQRVEFVQDEPQSQDLADSAVQTNNLQTLVIEYLARLLKP